MTNSIYLVAMSVLIAVGANAQPRQATDLRGKSASPRLAIQLGYNHAHPVHSIASVAFSPDNRYVLTSGDNAALWEVATEREVRRFETVGDVESVAFSPDGRYALFGSLDKTARLLEVVTGREVRRFEGHRLGVNCVAFSPDGRHVLTASEDGTVRLWEVATGRELRRFKGHAHTVHSVAFSPDGRQVLTGSLDKTARLWASATGRELRRFEGHGWQIYSVAFSPDGRHVLTGSGDNTARLWETATGREVRRFKGHADFVQSVAFSPDGRNVLTGGRDKIACLWETATGREVRRFTGHAASVTSVTFSIDGGQVLTGSEDKSARLWDVATGREVRRFQGEVESVNAVAFSPDGGHMLISGDNARLWELAIGREMRRFEGHDWLIYSAAFSPDGRQVLTGSGDQTARLWEVATGREVRRFFLGGSVEESVINSVAFSPDGQHVLIGGDRTVLWEPATGREIRRVGQKWVFSVSFSSDGRYAITGGADKTARLWEVATGRELQSFVGHVAEVDAVAFSPDGRHVLTGGRDNIARLWDTASGHKLHRFDGHAGRVNSVAFSPDGRRVLTGSDDNSARLWDVATGREVRRFEGHANDVRSVGFSPDGRVIVTGSTDGTTRLWKTETGNELVRLVSFTDGTWVVVAPDGRFDTNNLENIKGLHWVMPDDPLRALPLDIFLRDYYEPRLLPQLLAGKPLPDIRSLAELNRVQPKVRIAGIERDQTSSAAGETFSVMVEVSGESGEFGIEGKKRRMETGAYDLRLFRDGQLVGQSPAESAESSNVGLNSAEELKQWRKERFVVGFKDGKKEIVFSGIRLPRKEGLKEVEFSAYAFNEDRVKSETARMSFEVPKDLSPRAARAYIISIGVNAFEDNRWDLSYAANDAKELGSVLRRGLEASRDDNGKARYEKVIWVPLISKTEQGRWHISNRQASKERIEAVLKVLAGQEVKPGVLEGIENGSELRRANPEDLVIIAVSTHGEVDERGRFYFLPQDIGEKLSDVERLKRAISNDELSAWMRGLDASDLVMIVDACHSAASVENKEFKPGPMGSRGLGQLAYDKGMRILAATQVDQYALETNQTQLGLLSYALVRDGLERNQADYKPQDGKILLSEWLGYAAESVPKIYQDWREGKLRGGTVRAKLVPTLRDLPGNTAALQTPALFDFARRSEVMIGGGLSPVR